MVARGDRIRGRPTAASVRTPERELGSERGGGDDGGVALDTAPGAPLTDPALVAALRDDLAAAGYGVAGVEEVLGAVAADALHREEPVPALRATAAAADDVVAALIRTFLLGVTTRRRTLERALPTLTVDGAERLGLVEVDGDEVRARVDLRPYTAVDGGGEVDWWIASDLGELATGQALRTDHVLGVGGASTTLAQVTVRDEREHVLDLGTGCGIQALHASRHSRRVVGTDISRRALAFARFNAALAGVELDLREGSMLEPVAARAVRPRREQPAVRHHAADARDAVVRVPRRRPLRATRSCASWSRASARCWRPAAWRSCWATGRCGAASSGTSASARGSTPSGLDGWVVQRELQDPAQYAETWIRDGGTTPDRDRAAWARPVRAVAGRLRVAGRRGDRVRHRDPAQAARARRRCAGSRRSREPSGSRSGRRSRPRSPRTTGSR